MSYAEQPGCDTLVSRDTLMIVIETLASAFFVLDDTQTIIYANARAQAITGATQEELHGTLFWRSAPQLVSTALYQAVLKTRQTQEPAEVEYASPTTGNWLHVQLASTVGGVLLQFHELRAPARRKAPIPINQPLSAAVLDGLHAGLAVLTPEGIVLEINEALFDDAHIRREEVIGHPLAYTPWWSFSPASQAQLRAAIARASMGETVRFETLVRSREGMFLHVEGVITPHVNAKHDIEYLVIAGIDITARKRAEDEICLVIDTLPQLVWIMRPDGAADYCNQRWRDYTGMTVEQLQGDGWMSCTHPDDWQHVLAGWQHALHTGSSYETELRLRQDTTGDYRWFLVRTMPYRDRQGTIVKWVGTSTDIEEQKRIEAALRQSQERVNALMHSNIIGIFISEGEQIVDACDTFLRMTGYSREDLCAGRMNWLHMTPPDYLARTFEAQQELAARQSIAPYEEEYICKDGSRLPVLVGGVLLQQSPSQVITFVLDNSARKELEQRKDAFISMASHELRTPLTALKLQTAKLRRRLARQGVPDSIPALASMETQINAITRLVEELLDVSKIQAGKLEYVRERVDLDALLLEIADTMQHAHPSHRILVRGMVQTSLMGDRDRLGQVFTNLLGNAIKYSPDAQTVELELSASPEIVTIRVRDHGLGIPREQHDKIFERFHRAAEPRQRATPGLGMGLYIVAEIVKGHRGTITVDSEVGKGSTFTIALPARDMPEQGQHTT